MYIVNEIWREEKKLHHRNSDKCILKNQLKFSTVFNKCQTSILESQELSFDDRGPSAWNVSKLSRSNIEILQMPNSLPWKDDFTKSNVTKLPPMPQVWLGQLDLNSNLPLIVWDQG